MDMDLEKFKSDIIPLRSKLFRYAYKMVEDKDEAEDIVQETLLRLWSKREQLTEVSNPIGLAMQISKNICIDKLRSRHPTYDMEEHPVLTHDQTPYTYAEVNDSVNIIKQIIERLPGLQQRIIRMRDIEGFELKEIAEITGTTIAAITVNLSRARKKVRDEYMKYNRFISNTINKKDSL